MRKEPASCPCPFLYPWPFSLGSICWCPLLSCEPLRGAVAVQRSVQTNQTPRGGTELYQLDLVLNTFRYVTDWPPSCGNQTDRALRAEVTGDYVDCITYS